MVNDNLNKVIARLILSTKRKKRPYSLYNIAEDINEVRKVKGGLLEVSKILGISTGMLNQFLSVFKLPRETIELVKERKIDSVATIYYLSKFNKNDILILSNLIVNNKLSSHDIKILLPYRKQFPNDLITDLLNRINSSKNIKASVIRLNKEDTHKTTQEITRQFNELLGENNVITVEEPDTFIDVKLLKDGEIQLRRLAKSNQKTLLEFISSII